MILSRVLDNIDFKEKFARLPAFAPGDKEPSSLPATPSAFSRVVSDSPVVNASPLYTPGTAPIGNSVFFGPGFSTPTVGEQVHPSSSSFSFVFVFYRFTKLLLGFQALKFKILISNIF